MGYQIQIREVTGPAMSLWHGPPGEILGGSEIETCLPIEAPVSKVGRGKLVYLGHAPDALCAFGEERHSNIFGD